MTRASDDVDDDPGEFAHRDPVASGGQVVHAPVGRRVVEEHAEALRILAEHDPDEDRAALAAEARRNRPCEPVPEPVGETGQAAYVSGVGSTSASPYMAPPVDANRKRAPTCRAASSRWRPAMRLMPASKSGSRTERLTLICAA